VSLLQIAVLAIVQGLTEFLPVSSSAHLILVSKLGAWPDEGLEMDVAVHVGTLLAVLVYFRHEVVGLVRAWREPADDPVTIQRRTIGLGLVIGTVPVVLVGALFYDTIADSLRDVRIIAVSTLLFGVVLLLADRYSPRSRELRELRLSHALWIGLAQALALIPGTSRSGATLTMGRLLGFTPDAAARFSFLLSIPVIAAAGLRGGYELLVDGSGMQWQPFVLAMILAALAGWLCIAAFLALLARLGLLPFILYRLALGLVLLGISL
jgi:undecaprenyl-diphosphatase